LGISNWWSVQKAQKNRPARGAGRHGVDHAALQNGITGQFLRALKRVFFG